MRRLSKWMMVLVVALLMTLVMGIGASATTGDDGYGDLPPGDFNYGETEAVAPDDTEAPEGTKPSDEPEVPTTKVPKKRSKVYYDLTVSSTDGGSVPALERTSTFEKNTRVHMMAVAEEGYVFVGWNIDASGNDEAIVLVMDGEKVVEAVFEPIKAEVTETLAPETTAAETTAAETTAAETTAAETKAEDILNDDSPGGAPDMDDPLPQTAGLPVALVVTIGGMFGFAGLSLKRKSK